MPLVSPFQSLATFVTPSTRTYGVLQCARRADASVVLSESHALYVPVSFAADASAAQVASAPERPPRLPPAYTLLETNTMLCAGSDAHAPLSQCVPPVHTFEQAPQLLSSLVVSMQLLPHSVPAAHAHTPAAHVVAAGHTAPHLPQLASSSLKSTHDEPHAVVGDAQLVAHAPP